MEKLTRSGSQEPDDLDRGAPRDDGPTAGKVDRKIDRKASGEVGKGASSAEELVAKAGSGGGSPLPEPLREKFEKSLDADLSDVRVHTGVASQDAAAGIEARAYTLGNDIHFAEGEYDPGSREGEQLLAHEVAHTVQQTGGGARRKVQTKLEMSEPGDAHEAEADRAAENMVDGLLAEITGHSGVARKVMRTGTNSQGGNIEVLVDGAHFMPDLIKPRYSTGGRNFTLTYRGDFEVYRALYFNLSGANSGKIGTDLMTIWGSETLNPGYITSAGATSLNVHMTFFIQNNRSDTLNFDVKENGVKDQPVVTATTEERDLDISHHLTWAGVAGPTVPALQLAVADGVSLTETSTNTFTRTRTTTETAGVSGELSSGDAKEGLAGKLGATYSFATAEAGALAQSLAVASGVSTITTNTFTATASGLQAGKQYSIRVIPKHVLKTVKTVVYDARTDGVIPRGNPTKTIYTHSSKITGTLLYLGKTDAEALQKAQADDRSDPYPPAPPPGAGGTTATAGPGTNPNLPPVGHAGSDPDNPAGGNNPDGNGAASGTGGPPPPNP